MQINLFILFKFGTYYLYNIKFLIFFNASVNKINKINFCLKNIKIKKKITDKMS